MVGFDLNGDLLWVKKYHRNPLDLRMHPSNIKSTFLTHQEKCFLGFFYLKVHMYSPGSF